MKLNLSDLIIRPLTMGDLSQLKGLYDDLCNDEVTEVETMQNIYNKMLSDGKYTVLVAEMDNRILGTLVGIVCYELTRTGAPFMVVEDVIVDKANRNHGIGRLLMFEIEKVAKREGCFSIILVASQRRRVDGFYEKCGYSLRHGFRKDF